MGRLRTGEGGADVNPNTHGLIVLVGSIVAILLGLTPATVAVIGEMLEKGRWKREQTAKSRKLGGEATTKLGLHGGDG